MIHQFTAFRNLIDAMIGDSSLIKIIDDAGGAMVKSLLAGGKVMFCGNGGSAAIAQHLAAELVGRFKDRNRSPLAALSLTTDTSVLTAVANDYCYEQIFAQQVEALGRDGDVLLVMSTSGQSVNIHRALDEAKRNSKDIVTVGLFGGGCYIPCNYTFRVPSEDTALIQQAHLMIGHAMVGAVEKAFA